MAGDDHMRLACTGTRLHEHRGVSANSLLLLGLRLLDGLAHAVDAYSSAAVMYSIASCR